MKLQISCKVFWMNWLLFQYERPFLISGTLFTLNTTVSYLYNYTNFLFIKCEKIINCIFSYFSYTNNYIFEQFHLKLVYSSSLLFVVYFSSRMKNYADYLGCLQRIHAIGSCMRLGSNISPFICCLLFHFWFNY